MTTIDLNADLGEGFGRWSLTDDAGLLEVVSSANIACGFHAGDALTMRRVTGECVERGVSIGAQVSYRDLAGFGRRFIDVDPLELAAEVIYQVGALRAFAAAAGGRVAYVKPHGALYHAVAHHQGQAAAVVEALLELGDDLVLLGPAGSRALEIADAAGIRVARESFADRGYRADGSLVPRGEPGASLHGEEIIDRVRDLALGSEVSTVDGGQIGVRSDSICVHGDSPTAVADAVAARQTLLDAGVSVSSFA